MPLTSWVNFVECRCAARSLIGLCPIEVRRQCLPPAHLGKHHSTHGIGFREALPDAPLVRDWLVQLLVLIRRSGSAPLEWIMCDAAEIPHSDNVRIVVMQEPLGKVFFESRWAKDTLGSPASCQQTFRVWRHSHHVEGGGLHDTGCRGRPVAKSQGWTCNDVYDMTHVFFCAHHVNLEDAIRSSVLNRDAPYFITDLSTPHSGPQMLNVKQTFC